MVERSRADVSPDGREECEGKVGDGEGEGDADGRCLEIPEVSASIMVESSGSGDGVRKGGVNTAVFFSRQWRWSYSVIYLEDALEVPLVPL